MSVADVVMGPSCEGLMISPGYSHTGVGLSSDESIIIYLTVGKSVMPLRVWQSDSIASVKLRIQTCKGFGVKKQKLVLKGRELSRTNSLVRDYGLTKGNVLHLVLRLSDLLVITVTTACGKEFEFQVDRYENIGYLKQQIAVKGEGFVNLEDQELFYLGEKLDDQRLIDGLCKNTEAVIHLVVQKSAIVVANPVEKDVELSVMVANGNNSTDQLPEGESQPVRDFLLEPVIVNPKVKFPSVIRDMIKSTYEGLERGKQPIRSSEGTGGTYFMQDALARKYISIFKPADEEPNAVNNPQGLPLTPNGEGLKGGTRVGEGALREVAAFILDHPRTGPRTLSSGELGFAGVPPTVMVRCLHRGFNHPDGFEGTPNNVKMGSLQMFMKNSGCCEDLGPQIFPVEEVHKISVLDIRMANADRHGGNILLSRQGEEGCIVLIPIDHGYCLPETFEDCTFDWLYWPQAHQPYSPETIEYIKSMDADRDIELLKFYGWELSLECAHTLRISTMLLKKGAERGFTPFTIGSIMCRETVKKESVIEEIVQEAQDSVLPGTGKVVYLETVSRIMDCRLDKIAQQLARDHSKKLHV
ncbi:1-phosphatidylinositol 4-kinase [Bertholletia excelsa]